MSEPPAAVSAAKDTSGAALLRFLGFVMMTCGALVAAFSGLCAGLLLLITALASPQQLLRTSSDLSGLVLAFALASVTIWLGLRVYRRGGGG